MPKSAVESTLAKILYSIFSFLLSMLSFFLVLLIILQATFLNKNYILNMVNDSNYFSELSSEITEDLIDLGNASGINEAFFENFVDEVILREDVANYVENFYSGEDTSVDTTHFKQYFREKLDAYIAENNLTVSQDARQNLTTTVKEAAGIYASRVQLPYFDLIAGYFHQLLAPVFYVTLACAFVVLLIAVVMIATNKWKHRAYRYLSYSTLGTLLMTLAVPVMAYCINKLDKLAIMSRALFNLYYSCVTQFLNAFFIAAAVLALLSALFIYMHYRSRKKAIIGAK
ncbi:MAG TPA: hypothetical protein IAD32_04370 [Candidatus Scatavimonas merdigallinarum]|uniref:DUF1461 domain-containing protein n=1 Tax=Candidatus Scatavimonas merdigallinarum TaxID=2840914 RepID=A0A9D0ZHG3_9FIRM|nr:hypothetical protein [Candidatus Scatavimonas merdigallinarum]